MPSMDDLSELRDLVFANSKQIERFSQEITRLKDTFGIVFQGMDDGFRKIHSEFEERDRSWQARFEQMREEFEERDRRWEARCEARDRRLERHLMQSRREFEKRQRHTDERLNILISMVERYFSKGDNGREA